MRCCVFFLLLVVAACEQGDTPLHSGAMNDHVGIVRLLLEHGANINAADIDVRVVYCDGWAPATAWSTIV